MGHPNVDTAALQDGTRKAIQGTLLGIGMKILSFVLSQMTIRLVDPVLFGMAAIKLDLLLSSILFLSREGFRLALTRNDNSTKKMDMKNQTPDMVIDVAWLTVPVGIVLSFAALLIHLKSCDPFQIDYQMAGCLYCFAAMVESFAEPLVILYAFREMDVKTRAAAEASAALVKAMCIVGLLSFAFSNGHSNTHQWLSKYPVTVFGIGQLLHSIVLCSVYYVRKWNMLCFPTKASFDGPTLRLAGVFSIQGIFKHALTEGDRIILTALAQGYDQGVYAMAQSYGGLASRLILQPLEENSRLLFSRQHRLASSSAIGALELQKTLGALVKMVLYIGLTFACFATNYTKLLLRIMAGSKWGANDQAAAVLSAFCVYTSVMALNGTTEAFVYGVAQSGGEVGQLSVAHAVVGGAFAVLAPILVNMYGTVGLVMANGICMTLRSLYSLSFAAHYFSSKSKVTTFWNEFVVLAKAMTPHPFSLIAFAVSYFVTHKTALAAENLGDGLNASLNHVAIGALMFFVVMIVAFFTEQDFLKTARDLSRVKKD